MIVIAIKTMGIVIDVRVVVKQTTRFAADIVVAVADVMA